MGITLNVIDSMHGCPAEGIAVRLASQSGLARSERIQGCTDEGGGFDDWRPKLALTPGIYRIGLDVDAYYATLGIAPFLPLVIVVVRVVNSNDHHYVRVLITPYSHVIYIVKRS